MNKEDMGLAPDLPGEVYETAFIDPKVLEQLQAEPGRIQRLVPTADDIHQADMVRQAVWEANMAIGQLPLFADGARTVVEPEDPSCV